MFSLACIITVLLNYLLLMHSNNELWQNVLWQKKLIDGKRIWQENVDNLNLN